MSPPVTSPEVRFWRFVHPEPLSGCWLWSGAISNEGYGRFRFGVRGSKQGMAHRFAYELLVGPIPQGLQLDHLCRTPACVNPAHLEPVTGRENLLRGDTFQARNAAKTSCVHGHPFDERNTEWRPTGGRACRECRRRKVQAARQRLREKVA